MSTRNQRDQGKSDQRSIGTLPAVATAPREPALVAYRIHPGQAMPLAAAPRSREWMDSTREQYANRCLPLLIANQAGWLVMNNYPIRATWTGGEDNSSLIIDFPWNLENVCLDLPAACPAISHFGHGILTWHIPYLFRTPPGYNLLARGPANWPKDGAYALEGIVETDWSVATFTMNWQLTRPDLPVVFDAGEPICMVVPQRRGELEAFWPEIRDIQDDPALASAHQEWSNSRATFLTDLKEPGSEAGSMRWQKEYFRGIKPQHGQVPEHQVKLKLREFAHPESRAPEER